MLFADRADAGRRLGARLQPLRDEHPVVLGLPRGGVPVACEVARALGAPLDLLLVRKLGVPSQPELAMGAIGEGGVRVLDDDVVRLARVSARDLAETEARERVELHRRIRRYRGDRPAIPVRGRTAIIVDDGIATGSTARAACRVARTQGAARVVLAVPVAPRGWTARIGADADELVALETPDPFLAVGHFYADFSQTSDDEVVEHLARADRPNAAASRPERRPQDLEVAVQVGAARLDGILSVPDRPAGVVVFVHGSGSSRHSPRNRDVAAVLQHARLATLLFDLLTPGEAHDRANVFDVELLAHRLTDATTWVRRQRATAGLPIGYFGASTGAGAALWAAAAPDADIAAVVSRGGRPDLAGERLAAVRAPTLLIVGERDVAVLRLNQLAQAKLACENHLAVVPGATHLFEEPGALHVAAELTTGWFVDHFTPEARHRVASVTRG